MVLIQKIYKLSYFHAFSLSLLFGLVYYVLILRNDNSLQTTEKNLALLKYEVEQKEKEFEDIKTLVERYASFQSEYNMSKEFVDKFFKYIPNIQDPVIFFNNILNDPSVQAIGLKVNSYKPGEEITPKDKLGNVINDYKLLPLKISIEGNFSQLLLFIAHLTQIKQLIILEHFRISKIESTSIDSSLSKLSLEGDIVLYSIAGENTQQPESDSLISANTESSTTSLEAGQ